VSLRKALILVLIGGPLVVIDFTISQNGSVPFDILNDTIGFALLLWGTVLLARLEVSPVYSSRMRTVLFLTVFLLLWSVFMQVTPEAQGTFAAVLVSGLAVGGTILFCLAMRHLCETQGFAVSLPSWARATTWVTILFGGGWALGFVITLIRSATEGTLSPTGVYLEVGGAAILLLLVLLAVMLVPLIMVTIAISRLLGEMRVDPGAPPALPA
jgi:hypothetical protein